MSNVTLRIARVSDAHELLALYVPYVEETAKQSFTVAVGS